MKLILFAIVFTFVISGVVFGQSAKKTDALEQEIRKLEQAEVDAIMSGDYDKLDKLWAADYYVNTPFNKVDKASTGPIRSGSLKYSSFVREIESIQIRGNTVTVMGNETVKPVSNAIGAGGVTGGEGQILRRRYTNIWMKDKGKWLLTARHANIICSN